MVMVAIDVPMPRDRGTGEEDDRHHEHNSRDDHDPRRGLVKPAGLGDKRGLRRGRDGPGGLGGGVADVGWVDGSGVSVMP
ncbi:hypothetical protein MHEC_02840 [Mycobacterium heckeshornense]|uniref:Uncharacterized protein n=1 Tax=Mycobacterium heckeshornense TaxID=110505 RepID=A0A7R7GR57_9MYCO|nr:hypothetical protein MHEC_02840 [Mycobacterium heckeshornense]